MARPCIICGANSVSGYCFRHKRRKPMQRGRAMKKIGRVGRAELDQRAQFFIDHDPPYLCVYCLVIGIDYPLLPEEVNVEHGESKARHVDRRFDKTNLYISCPGHNKEKGSRDIDEYIAYLTEMRGAQPSVDDTHDRL